MEPMEKKDEEMMLDYQTGDQEAVGMIFQKYKTPIFNFCLRLLGNRADAEEASGEVFLALIANKNTYDSSARFSTWLYTIAHNKCVDQIRRRKRLVSLWFSSPEKDGYEQLEPADTDASASEELDKKLVISQVRLAINNLPYEQREAIILRQYLDLSYEQISQILNCSLEKVKVLIFRAKERLKDRLASFIKKEEL